MKLDPAKVYSMPLIMGPVFDRETRPGRVYGAAESISATFRTDPDAVRDLVPECFQIPDAATVTIAFGDYDRVDFMAGGLYTREAFEVGRHGDHPQGHLCPFFDDLARAEIPSIVVPRARATHLWGPEAGR